MLDNELSKEMNELLGQTLMNCPKKLELLGRTQAGSRPLTDIHITNKLDNYTHFFWQPLARYAYAV